MPFATFNLLPAVTANSLWFGLPPVLAAGMNPLSNSHCSSVMSLMYDFLAALMIFCPTFFFKDRFSSSWELFYPLFRHPLTDRLYEGMQIAGVKGLTTSQKIALELLDALAYHQFCPFSTQV
jgi:hypothetical protein